MKHALVIGGLALALSAPAYASPTHHPFEGRRGVYALSLEQDHHGAFEGNGRGEGHRKGHGRGHDGHGSGHGYGHDKYDHPDSD